MSCRFEALSLSLRLPLSNTVIRTNTRALPCHLPGTWYLVFFSAVSLKPLSLWMHRTRGIWPLTTPRMFPRFYSKAYMPRKKPLKFLGILSLLRLITDFIDVFCKLPGRVVLGGLEMPWGEEEQSGTCRRRWPLAGGDSLSPPGHPKEHKLQPLSRRSVTVVTVKSRCDGEERL